MTPLELKEITEGSKSRSKDFVFPLDEVYFYMKYNALAGADGCEFDAETVALPDLYTLQDKGFDIQLVGDKYRVSW